MQLHVPLAQIKSRILTAKHIPVLVTDNNAVYIDIMKLTLLITYVSYYLFGHKYFLLVLYEPWPKYSSKFIRNIS